MTYLVFIAEITGRAFIVADSNKRRTLSRADIAKALTKSDHFDFLIDIVPREEAAFSGHHQHQPHQQGDEVLSMFTFIRIQKLIMIFRSALLYPYV